MKIKLSKLVNAVSSLQGLSKRDDLPIKVAYALVKNYKKIDTELKAFEETKNKLFEKYGEKVVLDKKGNVVEDESKGKKVTRIKKEHIETFNKEIDKILEDEIDLQVHKIKIEIFEDVKIKPQTLMAIDFLLED